MSDFDSEKSFGKLRTGTKFSRTLYFRETRGFVNLHENKVLAKIKCYTVNLSGMADSPRVLEPSRIYGNISISVNRSGQTKTELLPYNIHPIGRFNCMSYLKPGLFWFDPI